MVVDTSSFSCGSAASAALSWVKPFFPSSFAVTDWNDWRL